MKGTEKSHAACDVCGGDSAPMACVEIGWSCHLDGYTMFGGPLSPGRAERTLCMRCFRRLSEAVAIRPREEA